MKNFNNQGRSYGRGRHFGGGAGQTTGSQGTQASQEAASQEAGPGGLCVCPVCGEKAEHQAGFPCNEAKCPKCGAFMTREN